MRLSGPRRKVRIMALLSQSSDPTRGIPAMAPDGSITRWIGLLQAGDPAAVQQLWERYFRRLVGLARKKLAGSPRRAADEEDVALSAFDTFCRRAEQGRFPQLSDRDSLWRLLVVITARKAAHQVHYDQRQKRVPPRPAQAVSQANQPDLDQIISREPRPDDVVVMAEEYQRL